MWVDSLTHYRPKSGVKGQFNKFFNVVFLTIFNNFRKALFRLEIAFKNTVIGSLLKKKTAFNEKTYITITYTSIIHKTIKAY